MTHAAWPELPLSAWKNTYATLCMLNKLDAGTSHSTRFPSWAREERRVSRLVILFAILIAPISVFFFFFFFPIRRPRQLRRYALPARALQT